MIETKTKEQTLALAGVFQAAELVHQAASQGAWSAYAAEQSIGSLFKLDADSVDEIYDGPYGVRLGLRTLTSMLSGQADNIQSLKYVVNLLQLERKFSNLKRIHQQLAEELQRIGNIKPEYGAEERMEAQVEQVAQLYQQTISTISPRIQVRGELSLLQQDRNIHWIRALLMAGLRSAVLWRQTGGNRFSLLFGRKKLLRNAERLLSA